MAKICSTCETINPSKANHCTNCGKELPDKEMSIEDQLRVELNDAKKSKEILLKTLETLEKSLANAQKGIFPELEEQKNENQKLYQRIDILTKEASKLLFEKQRLENILTDHGLSYEKKIEEVNEEEVQEKAIDKVEEQHKDKDDMGAAGAIIVIILVALALLIIGVSISN
jgi:hypothetical protein